MKVEDVRTARDNFLRQIAKENINPGIGKTAISQILNNIIQYCETKQNEMDAVIPPEIAPLLNIEMRARFWAVAMSTLHDVKRPPKPPKGGEEVLNGQDV